MPPPSSTPRRPFTDPPPPYPHYDFATLLAKSSSLRQHASIPTHHLDLSSRAAVYALSRAILHHHFSLSLTLPPPHLVPTIPNRVQYLLWATSLLGTDATNDPLAVLDIGTGPSCIYALLGARLFPTWRFVATDVDADAVQLARDNVHDNMLAGRVHVIHVRAEETMLGKHVRDNGVVLTVCNPPFHAAVPPGANRAGTPGQLATAGGEVALVRRLAEESTRDGGGGVRWFTSLVGVKADVGPIMRFLRSAHVRALYVRTVELWQGGRTRRWAVAWSFGAERSVVRVVDDGSGGTKWRVTVVVRPGRRFANQLETRDVQGCFVAAMEDMGWSDRYGRGGEEGTETARVYGPESGCFEGVVVHVQVTSGKENGEFRAHLKVCERAQMSASELQQLGADVAAAVGALLDPRDVPSTPPDSPASPYPTNQELTSPRLNLPRSSPPPQQSPPLPPQSAP